MALGVGDIGTVISLDITENDAAGIAQPTDFDTDNATVTFVFRHSDGTITSGAGTWVNGGKAQYTTADGDITSVGRLEIQLHIVSTAWTGVTDIFCTDVVEKIVIPS